jgi:hypothetical protein
MTAHHILEAVGILVLGLLFYSYTFDWLTGPHLTGRLRRALLHGLSFGVLTVAMMIARIEIESPALPPSPPPTP